MFSLPPYNCKPSCYLEYRKSFHFPLVFAREFFNVYFPLILHNLVLVIVNFNIQDAKSLALTYIKTLCLIVPLAFLAPSAGMLRTKQNEDPGFEIIKEVRFLLIVQTYLTS